MNESNKELLEKEIQQELEALEEMEIGTDEYKVAVDGLTKLLDRAIELKKIEADSKAKDDERELKVEQLIVERDRLKADADQRVIDNGLKEKQLRQEKVNNIIGHSIAVAGIALPILVRIWGTRLTFKFEEHGTITTTPGRSYIGNLFREK
jgi:hypothetical protein